MTQVANLALVNEVVQRRECLLYRGFRIRPMDLVEIDPVGAQAAERV
jgi:hypothetical protein